jgi:D-alanyl-D-alanine carboxypeptidase
MKALKIMGIGLAILIVIAGLFLWWAYEKGKPAKLAEFIRDNPDRASIYLVQNDSVLADFHSDRVMPLASTVKIIIAIEYARQAAAGMINPNEWIDTALPARFYIPNTDGNAHPNWLKDMEDNHNIVNGKVRLEEIAKGMIRYSSNANTEFLMEKLGLDSINSNLARLGLIYHQPLYPIVSALFVLKGMKEEVAKKMPMDAYIDSCYAIHKRLLANDNTLKQSLDRIPMYIQKIWSDRLPGSTTAEYVSILKKINDRNFFDAPTQNQMDTLMGGVMENPLNSAWLVHAGMKGGSTAFVLTMAMYATTRTGEKTEVAYFFNNLKPSECLFWQTCLNDFHLAILKDKKKRNELLAIINSQGH